MAVFYKGIKGCSTGASLNKGLWTYITWSNGNKDYIQSATSLPKISVKFDAGSEIDLGHILTDNVPCTINKPWYFNEKIITNQILKWDHLPLKNVFIEEQTLTPSPSPRGRGPGKLLTSLLRNNLFAMPLLLW